MDDKQNQPEFMVASMGVAHKQPSFHCVYTHFVSVLWARSSRVQVQCQSDAYTRLLLYALAVLKQFLLCCKWVEFL